MGAGTISKTAPAAAKVEAPRRSSSFCSRVTRAAFVAAVVACGVALLMGQIPLVGDAMKPAALDPQEEYREHYTRYWPTEDSWRAEQEERQRFLAKYSPKGEYGYGGTIEATVAQNLHRFANEVYLDYTGASVFQESQLRRAHDDIATNAYGNAHSKNPSASRSDRAIAAARKMVLKYFNADPSEYTVIFTSGATGALKLVADSFPWTNASTFMYLRQNHNSVLGIREVALDQGARFESITEEDMSEDTCNRFIGGQPCHATSKRTVVLTDFPETTYNLFAFPAQDNFAGVKYPLEWVNWFKQKKRGEEGTGHWLTLVDAAAFVPTNKLDLTKYPADFVTMSFYKIFGYPTGLGALLVRNEVTEVMQKTFFGGGTVIASSCDTHFCLLHRNPCNRFEDGTVNFLAIATLKYGFEEMMKVGVENITKHVWSITKYAYDQLSALRHSTGVPVLEIYGKHEQHNASRQGGIINFLVRDPKGAFIGYHVVQQDATKAAIHVRSGCHCNPGACYGSLGITSEEVERFSLTRESCGDEQDIREGRPLGTLRASFGYLTTFEDVRAFVEFIKSTYVK